MALKLIISRQPDGQEIFYDFSASSLSEINSSENSVVIFFSAQTITGNGDVSGEKYYYGTRISLVATGRGAALGESLGRLFSIALQSPDVESRINLFELANSVSVEDIVGSAPSGGGPTGGSETLNSVTTRGATTGNAINVGGITTDFVQLDLTATPAAQQGMFFWNEDRSTANLQLDTNVAAKIGQDNYWYVKNQSGSDIPIRTAVMASGALGASGRILVSPMVSDGSVDAKFLLGITAEEIEDGADGFVMNIGKLRQVNTSLFPDGTVLYCDPTVPGGLTGSEPQAPNLKLPIAFCINQSTNNGTIAVRTNPGSDLYSDHRVQVDQAGLTGGQLLRYNGSLTRWENWTPNFLTTVPTLDQVTTAGNSTTNSIIVGGLTVDTDLIYTDTVNNRVGIGTTGPSEKLDVNGNLNILKSGSGSQSNSYSLKLAYESNTATDESVSLIANPTGTGTSFLVSDTRNSNLFKVSNLRIEWTNGIATITRSGAGTPYEFGGDSPIRLYTGSSSWASITTNAKPLYFGTLNQTTAHMSIATSGNVLIGTTTDAGYKLDVNGTLRTTGSITTDSSIVGPSPFLIYSQFSNRGRIDLWSANALPTTPQVQLLTDGNVRMSVTKEGNVGIGITTPTYKLQVVGTVSAQLTNATHTDQVYYDSVTGQLTYDSLSIPTSQEVADSSKVTATAPTGSTQISAISATSYTSARFEYTITDSTNYRTGTISAVWDNSTVQFAETSTSDIGDTSALTFAVSVTGGTAELVANAVTGGWTVYVVGYGI
jgi:hypothetical protein